MQLTCKQQLLYKYLNEKAGKTIHVDDLQKFTGYTRSTVHTYIRKKLINVFVKDKEYSSYSVLEKIKDYDEERFQKYLSQVSEKCKK